MSTIKTKDGTEISYKDRGSGKADSIQKATKMLDKFLTVASASRGISVHVMRLAIAIVFIWIGMLKFVPYEADSITPFVANSPLLSIFYKYPEEYKAHFTPEGRLVQAQREWQQKNHTYSFSDGLGTLEVTIGVLVLLNAVSRYLGLLGGLLALATPFVTLSFLITTPEAWVQPLGDLQHGFPYLSGAGRLVLKDVLLLAGALLVVADSARAILKERVAVGIRPIASSMFPADRALRKQAM